MASPYYSPADYGLQIVAELDVDEPYEFDMVVVWRDGEGHLYGAHDAGCSCPTPFEEFSTTSDMVAIGGLDDVHGLLGEMSQFSYPSAAAVLDFIAKVRAALKVAA